MNSALFFCPCSEPLDGSEARDSSDAGEETGRESIEGGDKLNIPQTLLTDPMVVHPLAHLYFCNVCMSIRCPKCVENEVISVYCPSCLTTPTSGLEYGGQCTRNCFQCPQCSCYVSSSETAETVSLKCCRCPWKLEMPRSKRVNKNRSLVKYATQQSLVENQLFQQLLALHVADESSSEAENAIAQATEAELAARRLEKERKLIKQIGGEPGSADKIARSSALYGGKLIPEPILISMQPENESIKRRQEAISNEGETSLRRQLLSGENATERPIGVKLRSRAIKRCRACREVLIHPSSNPKSSSFKTKSMARLFVPSIEVMCSRSSLRNNTLCPSLLFTNPLEEAIEVSVSTFHTVPGRFPYCVRVPCSSFKLESKIIDPGVPSERIIVKSAPTENLIGDNTEVRAELFARRAKVDSTGDSTPVETGPGWARIVLEIRLGSVKKSWSETTKRDKERDILELDTDRLVEVPLFVSIATLRPEEENISIGFWIIARFDPGREP